MSAECDCNVQGGPLSSSPGQLGLDRANRMVNIQCTAARLDALTQKQMLRTDNQQSQ